MSEFVFKKYCPLNLRKKTKQIDKDFRYENNFLHTDLILWIHIIM